MWGGALAFIAFPDGDGMEPEELRDYVQSLGWSDFIMGDGGRKVNYYNRSTGDMVQGRDPSQNLILVYKRKEPHPSPATAGRMGSGRTTERMRPAREGGAKDAKSVRMTRRRRQ